MVTRRALLQSAAASAATLAWPWARAQECALEPLLDGIAAALLGHLPEVGVYNGVPAALHGGPLARRMDDWSPGALEAYRATLRAAAQRLAAFDCALPPAQQLQREAARTVLAAGTSTADIAYGRNNPLWYSGHVPYVIAPVAGPHIDTINTMLERQSLADQAALDAWLSKLEDFGRGFDAVRDKLAADEAAGCRAPQILLTKSLPVLDAFLKGEARGQPLLLALRERTAALPAALRAAAQQRALAAVDGSARPAIARLRAQVAALAARGRAEAGVWAQPRGEALYAANVRYLGDTTLTPAEIHARGREEMRRIAGELEARLRRLGHRRGSVAARLRALAAEPRFRFGSGDAARTAALAAARRLIAGAQARYDAILPADFRPRSRLEVRRTPPASEAGAPFAYCDPPPLDPTRPGIYWLNLRDPDAVTRINLPSTTYHEAVPGHFTQGSLALQAPQVPLLLRLASFNAYAEGWALYCERLMAELGAYADDAYGDLGRLDAEMLRAVRLVVDTGMHALRWTREQAIDFMRAATGDPDSDVIAEVERYMAWPGQALGYKLGQLRLLELRGALARRLGARYDLREFHRAVLAAGALPLALIERQVARVGA